MLKTTEFQMNKTSQQRRATLEDIARLAACSRNTASLAMRNSPRISVKRRKEIHDIAEQLGYIPSFAARQLGAQRSGMVGIYSNRLKDEVRISICHHLLRSLHNSGYRPILGLKDGISEEWQESSWMQIFRELNADAIIVISQEVLKELPKWVSNTPVIVVGCYPNNALPCDYLALDRREAGDLAVNHLLEKGHRNFLLAVPSHLPFHDECLKRIKAGGGKVSIFSGANQTQDDNIYDEARLFAANGKPAETAAIFGGTTEAIPFMRGILDSGLQVPKDMAIVSYDYYSLAPYQAVPLTTIEQPVEQIAASAIRIIHRRLTQPNAPYTHEVLPHQLKVRASSA